SVVVLALLAGCHKKTEAPANGSAAVETGSGSAAVATPPPAPTKDVGKALDDALAAKHLAPDAVLERVASPTSAWAVVATKLDDVKNVVAIDVVASRADGVAEVHLAPPTGKASFKSVDSLEAKDLDGNGTDEATLVLHWVRETSIKGEQPGWQLMADEEGHQLYVLGGAPVRVAFTHLISYTSTATTLPEDNTMSKPDDETVTYDWSIAGKPPAVSLKRTKSEVAAKDRVKGTLEPASDPVFAAGSGKDMPLSGL
ncbi:MAG: hypothetical protein JO257_20260, partial [Deltaproteobacteria bacterium]|nr:hypothetical protein [Deltaproteobacteria bacterium]